jgi:hypothetical protein
MGEKNPFGIKKNRIYDRVVPIIRFLKGGRLFEKSISVPRLYREITWENTSLSRAKHL